MNDNVLLLNSNPDDEVKLLGPPGIPTENSRWNLPAILPLPLNKKEAKLPAPKKRTLTVMKDHKVDYPELWLSVYVSPDPDVADDEARFAKMFSRARCTRALTVQDADIVVFAGGSDVDPAYYGAERHMTTCFNEDRDFQDLTLYNYCLGLGIPMLGICRGAQFLHVMNGGKLYQDVNGHYGDHNLYDKRTGKTIDKVSSVHHQMVIQNDKMEVIATTFKSTERAFNNDKKESGYQQQDVEAFYYRETACLGIQGHPEYENYPYFTKWVFDLIEELVIMNVDLEWKESKRRLKPDMNVITQAGIELARAGE